MTDSVNVTFVDRQGQDRSVSAKCDESLMVAARDNDIDGIDADCGGWCSCGTCHVLVDEAWLSKLRPREANEDDLIEGLLNSKQNSRLSCQIKVNSELEGLRVTVAPEE